MLPRARCHMLDTKYGKCNVQHSRTMCVNLCSNMWPPQSETSAVAHCPGCHLSCVSHQSRLPQCTSAPSGRSLKLEDDVGLSLKVDTHRLHPFILCGWQSLYKSWILLVPGSAALYMAPQPQHTHKHKIQYGWHTCGHLYTLRPFITCYLSISTIHGRVHECAYTQQLPV